MEVKNLIVGCGLSGAVLAERLANKYREQVLVIDKRSHIGGNIYDYKEDGIIVHKYGPHVFHTNNKQVWDYLSQFTDWHRFMYRVKAVIDGIEVNIPFNLDSLHKVFPQKMAEKLEEKLISFFGYDKKVTILELKKANDNDLHFLADYIYRKVFLGYTVKQWGVKPEDLDSSVSARVPILINRDDRYFQDKYQGIPLNGYTAMVEKMLAHPLIEVKLDFDFKTAKNCIQYEKLFYTGAIDEFFDYELGELPYRSLDIQFKKYDCEYYQSGPQINFPVNYDYTRSAEYKYYLNEKSDCTILSYEYPCDFEQGKNERYYPIPNEENQLLFEQYKAKASQLENVYFLGRLGDYKYYNMDQVVEKALNLFNEV